MQSREFSLCGCSPRSAFRIIYIIFLLQLVEIISPLQKLGEFRGRIKLRTQRFTKSRMQDFPQKLDLKLQHTFHIWPQLLLGLWFWSHQLLILYHCREGFKYKIWLLHIQNLGASINSSIFQIQVYHFSKNYMYNLSLSNFPHHRSSSPNPPTNILPFLL